MEISCGGYRGWRTWRWKEDMRRISEIKLVEDLPCLGYLDTPNYPHHSCNCHYFCDFCGDEIWIKAMRQITVDMASDGEPSQVRQTFICICIECLEELRNEIFPDIKEVGDPEDYK